MTFLNDDAQPTDPWTPQDKKLLMAWTILQKETCNECGQPIWICRSSNNNVTFAVRKGVCYSKMAMEKWTKDRKDKPKPGETAYTIVSLIDETKPLPTRAEYLMELNED